MRLDDGDIITEVQKTTGKFQKKTGNTGIEPHTSQVEIEVYFSTVGEKLTNITFLLEGPHINGGTRSK